MTMTDIESALFCILQSNLNILLW